MPLAMVSASLNLLTYTDLLSAGLRALRTAPDITAGMSAILFRPITASTTRPISAALSDTYRRISASAAAMSFSPEVFRPSRTAPQPMFFSTRFSAATTAGPTATFPPATLSGSSSQDMSDRILFHKLRPAYVLCFGNVFDFVRKVDEEVESCPFFDLVYALSVIIEIVPTLIGFMFEPKCCTTGIGD